MGSKKGMTPANFAATPYGGDAGMERYRPRTPAETVDDAYDAMVQATTLNAVTHMAYDSVRTVAEHKDKLLADYPQLAAELNALGFNHVQGLMSIQRQVTDNVRKEKG